MQTRPKEWWAMTANNLFAGRREIWQGTSVKVPLLSERKKSVLSVSEIFF
jgi:hypothetical protein